MVKDFARRAEQAVEAHRLEPIPYGSDGLPPPIGIELGLRAPVFDEPPVPWSYPDRVWSVRGLSAAAEALIDDPRCHTEGGAPPVVLVRGRFSRPWYPSCPKGERCPPQYAWALLVDPELEQQQLALRVVEFDLPIDPSEAALWRGVPRVELIEGETYVFSGRLVRLDWDYLPERFALELFAVTADDPRAPNAKWQQVRGHPEHPVARANAGLDPVAPGECEIPTRFANPAPPRSTAPIISPTGVADAMRRANAASAQNDIPRADYYLRSALLLAPERTDLWIELAKLHLLLSRESALAVLEAGIAKNPLAADLHAASAMLHSQSRRLFCGAKELSFALRAVELFPDDPVQLYWLAKVQVCTRRTSDAARTLERLLERADARKSGLEPWMVEEASCMLARLTAVLVYDDGNELTCARLKRFNYFRFPGAD